MRFQLSGRVAVIVVVSPMAAFYLEKLVSQYCGGFERVYVLEIYEKKLILDSDFFTLIRFNYQNKFDRLLAFYRAVKYINKIVARHLSFAFFIAHPMHLVTNYVARLCRRKNFELNMIPDGVVNYYHCPVSRFKKSIYIKRCFSPFLAMGFFDLRDDCLGFDVFSYATVFSLARKNLIVGDCKVVKLIKFDDVSSEKRSSSGLVIGQRFDGISSMVIFDIIRSMVSCLRERGASEVYYKPHPSEVIDELFVVFLNSLDVKLCGDKETAEFLVDKYMFFGSVASSALANIKIISPSSVCVAFICFAYRIIPASQVLAIRSYFEGLGVDVYD